MKEVTKEEYQKSFIGRDAVLNLTGMYPYTAEWRLRGSGTLIAKSVEQFVAGSKYHTEVKYYIN